MTFLPWFIIIFVLSVFIAAVVKRLRVITLTLKKQQLISNWLPAEEDLKMFKIEAHVMTAFFVFITILILKFVFKIDTQLFHN